MTKLFDQGCNPFEQVRKTTPNRSNLWAGPRFPADWNAYAQQEREGLDEVVNVVTAWTGVPHPSSEPHEITVAADGTVWVALETGSVVSPVPQEFTPQPPSTPTNSKRPHGNTRIRD